MDLTYEQQRDIFESAVEAWHNSRGIQRISALGFAWESFRDEYVDEIADTSELEEDGEWSDGVTNADAVAAAAMAAWENRHMAIVNGYKIGPDANLTDAELTDAKLFYADLTGAELTLSLIHI